MFNGRPFFEGLDTLGRTFLVTETMALVQFGIGEMGNGMDTKWEGSIPHMLLHGGVGCIAIEAMRGNCASGFFAGVSQSVLAGSNLTDAQKLQLAPLVGSLAGFLWADGQAVGVNFGGTIAQSGLVNNYLTHEQLADLENQLAFCSTKSDPELCRTLLRDAARSLSAAQDLKLLRDWASCQTGNTDACSALDRQTNYLTSLTSAQVVADIRPMFPGESEQQLRDRANRYLAEFQASYDSGLLRAVGGSFQAFDALSAASLPFSARSTLTAIKSWISRPTSRAIVFDGQYYIADGFKLSK